MKTLIEFLKGFGGDGGLLEDDWKMEMGVLMKIVMRFSLAHVAFDIVSLKCLLMVFHSFHLRVVVTNIISHH